MASPKITEGEIPFDVPNAGTECKTWYRIVGELTPDTRPLIVLHGGPGFLSDYIQSVGLLASTHGLTVILYDQLGCGRSTHLAFKNGDESFWTEKLFRDELANLISHLSINSYDLLGHSWGGMLGAAYATYQPKGLRRLIISNSPASMLDWSTETAKLRAQLPADVREVLDRCEREGKTETEEYEQAVTVFYERFACRKLPWPEDFLRSLEEVKKDPTVYHTMNGPSEFHVIGSLKTWNVIPELHKIKVTTLLINGRYDEAQDATVQPYFDGIEKVKWITIEDASHMAHLEQPEKYRSIVANFLKA